MSLLLNCQSISKTFSSNELFGDLSFSINQGDKLGILGPNGCGKSTLMKILAGKMEPDAGEIVYRKNTKVYYVEQKTDFNPDESVYESLRKSAVEANALDYEIDGLVNSTLGKIGFADPDQKVGELSGGWKKRLEIATGVVSSPDLLLLDEPTNHLDIEGILWLEKFLRSANFSWVVISHDRTFLQNTVTKIAEINRQYPEGIMFSKGRYQDFLVNRLDALNAQAKLEETLANKARREIEWLRRGPKARSTKAKYRIDAAADLQAELADVKSRNRVNTTRIDFTESGRKSKKLVTMENVTKAFETKSIVKNFDMTLVSKRKIGILGKNGSGKSTLLKMIAKTLQPDSGEVEHIIGLKVVYFDQNREELNPDWLLRRALSETGDHVIYRDSSVHVASWARRFLFTNEHLNKKLSKLSGGEQAKTFIARLMLRPADLLLLDEPTNDLDIPTMETLEESLLDFPGTAILVSHDRYMLQKVCDAFIGLDGMGNAQLYADYEQWEKEALSSTAQDQQPSKAGGSATSGASGKKRRKKLSYNDQRDYDGMEESIQKLEGEIEEKTLLTQKPEMATNSKKLEAAYNDLQQTQEKLDSLYVRWGELEAMLS